MPIYDGSIDNIIGVVHLKDLMRGLLSTPRPGAHREPTNLSPMTAGACAASSPGGPRARIGGSGRSADPDAAAHYNLVIVVDEYGGTAGMVTIEDLVERRSSANSKTSSTPRNPLARGEDGRIYVRGDVLVEDINDALEIALPVDGVDTIGGLMLSKAGKIPAVGDKVLVGSIEFRIEKVVRNGVTAVSFPADEELLARAQPAAEEFEQMAEYLIPLASSSSSSSSTASLWPPSSPWPRPRVPRGADGGGRLRLRRATCWTCSTRRRTSTVTSPPQVGITIASLGLGMYGEHVRADWLLGPLEHLGWVGDALAHTVATAAAVGMLTYLHVVVGEMVPKSLALQNAAHAVIWLSNSMRLAEILFRPLTAVLNGLGNLILRLSGLPPADVESKLISSDELPTFWRRA
ncbi:MAG: CNNM domain-containing protein [Caldilineaceae bacterium]